MSAGVIASIDRTELVLLYGPRLRPPEARESVREPEPHATRAGVPACFGGTER